MIILTGNDLKSGAVVWWDGANWSIHIEDAVEVADDAEMVLAREESSRRVNVPYSVEATLTDGVARPNHIKDRIRALGPTVRPDLTLKPADPEIGNWVI